jgi:uncharacterized membrane protein
MELSKKQAVYILIVILFLGSLLRLYNLTGESFWLDEGTTALTIKKYDALEIFENVKEYGQILPDYYSFGKYAYDEDLPSYYMILKSWTRIFGISDFSLRLFSAVFGILSIVAVFLLIRYIFDDKVGLLTAFLASINLSLIWHSQEARQYIFLLFLSLLSLIFLLRALREGGKRHLIGLLIVNIIIIFSHFPWLIFILFEGLYALYVIYMSHNERKFRKLHKLVVIVFVVIALLYLPIISRAIFSESQYVRTFGRPGIEEVAKFTVSLSTWLYPSISMRDKIYSRSFDFSVFEWALVITVFASALLYGGLFLFGLIKLYGKKGVFVVSWFFFPFLFALLLSLIHPTITVFMVRQLIYIIPAYLAIVSFGCLSSRYSKILIVGIVILTALPLYAYYSNVDKQQFREVASFLPDNEPIFLNIETSQVIFQYYYGERDNVMGVSDVQELSEHLADVDTFWMLLTFTKYSDPEDTIKEFLDSNYELVERKDFFDIELLRYRTLS